MFSNNIQDFYHELKKENPNEMRIRALAKSISLKETYNQVDALTFAIFYQSKVAFHILLNRGIDTLPEVYKDIPPLLWSLEIPNKYFLLQMLRRTKVNMFHIEKKYGENLLSNICLKINDLRLFRRVFLTMEKANMSSLKSLMTTRVTVDDKRMYPLEICLYTLDSKMFHSNNQAAETICFQKIQTLLCFQMSLIEINPIKILEMITSFTNILNYNSCLIQKIIDFLSLRANIPELLDSNSNLITNSIIDKQNRFTKILLSYSNLDDHKLGEYVCCALKHANYDIMLHLIKLGANIDSIVEKEQFINIAIATDNLRLYQRLTSQDKYKYYIWQEKYSANFPIIPFEMPVNYRALHLACAFEAISIANYLIESIGDSLTYKGQAEFSPLEILERGVTKGHMTQTFANELTTPRISYHRFKTEDTHSQNECCICLDTLCGQEITMLECGHAFHSCCLRKNKETSMECPYCRSHVIHKYNSHGKIAMLESKAKVRPDEYCLSMCYHEEKAKVCIPIKSNEAEDASSYQIYQGNDLEKIEKKRYMKNHQLFLEKMEQVERPILLEKVRTILVKNKIGKRPSNMISSTLYDFRTKDGYHHPPGTPVPRKKIPITPATLERKYNICQSNIITGPRRSRCKKPNYLINEC